MGGAHIGIAVHRRSGMWYPAATARLRAAFSNNIRCNRCALPAYTTPSLACIRPAHTAQPSVGLLSHRAHTPCTATRGLPSVPLMPQSTLSPVPTAHQRSSPPRSTLHLAAKRSSGSVSRRTRSPVVGSHSQISTPRPCGGGAPSSWKKEGTVLRTQLGSSSFRPGTARPRVAKHMAVQATRGRRHAKRGRG